MSNNPTCEFVPSFVALTNFKTGIRDYYEVERIVNNYLNGTSIQYIHDADYCLFTCTQIYDAGEERIDSISIFWDVETEEHVLEVRRLKGDNLFHCSLSSNFHKIYDELSELFSQQKPIN
jgi:hypothetical protein